MALKNKTIREMQEERESEILSLLASLSMNTLGRLRKEQKCAIRTEYQRDRDRILYSKAFRRLKHKTQVFISPEGDHYRTRLTHTLEVSQISRSIARALRLNEDLTEAISLGHDIGHAPFGHAGEYILDELLRKYDPSERFRHFEQSLRVVDFLEEGKGLNLTIEVRDGIVKHSKGRKSLVDTLTMGSAGEDAPITQEGNLVRIADRLAYINHDIDDALRAGLITFDMLPRTAVRALGTRTSERIGKMIIDVIKTSMDLGRIAMSTRMARLVEQLKEFMFKHVYIDSKPKEEEVKAKRLITQLFFYYMENPDRIPINHDGLDMEKPGIRARYVCDHIAGMTDRFAVSMFNDIFVPKVWVLQ